MQMSQKQNNQAMHYVACFSDPEHNEWFDTYWHEELAMLFQQGNLVVANMDRLHGEICWNKHLKYLDSWSGAGTWFFGVLSG